jgi:hypothetical protein
VAADAAEPAWPMLASFTTGEAEKVNWNRRDAVAVTREAAPMLAVAAGAV